MALSTRNTNGLPVPRWNKPWMPGLPAATFLQRIAKREPVPSMVLRFPNKLRKIRVSYWLRSLPMVIR